MTGQLGTQAEAQQRVLASGITSNMTSWRDVDDKIKEVEKEVIKERKK